MVDSSALRGAESSELIRIEVRPIVSDDALWNSISECQFSDKTDSGAGLKVLDRFSFDPFGKLVDCNEHMSEAAPADSQSSNHIQSPNNKGPDEGDGLQGLHWLVRHVGVKLAAFASVDYIFFHFICSWPIESGSVCFSHDGPRGRMMATGPRVDVVENHSTLFQCYAFLADSGCAFPEQLSSYHSKGFGSMDDLSSLFFIFWEFFP